MPRLPGASTLALGRDDWRSGLTRIDLRGAVVLHLAARVHTHGAAADPWVRDNVEKTEQLARAAASQGAARFVFMSTLKVHGEETRDAPFRPADTLQPQDGYASSKARAEEALARISREEGMPVSIVRAPLVFGPGAKANLHAAVRLARSALPLPFASLHNRRSWIHVSDLCDLLLSCASEEGRSNAVLIASHPRPFSTRQLFAGLRTRLGRKPHLFGAPPEWLEGVADIAGRGQAMRRLTRSLEGDPGDAMARFGWRPAVEFDAALEELVRAPVE